MDVSKDLAIHFTNAHDPLRHPIAAKLGRRTSTQKSHVSSINLQEKPIIIKKNKLNIDISSSNHMSTE